MKTLATISSDFAAMARVAKALEVSELQLHTMEAWYKGRISKLLSRSRFGGTESLKLTPDGIIAHIVWNWEFPEYEDVLIPFRFFTKSDADKARTDWQTYLAAKAKAEQDKLNQTQATKQEADERATYERLRAKFGRKLVKNGLTLKPDHAITLGSEGYIIISIDSEAQLIRLKHHNSEDEPLVVEAKDIGAQWR